MIGNCTCSQWQSISVSGSQLAVTILCILAFSRILRIPRNYKTLKIWLHHNYGQKTRWRRQCYTSICDGFICRRIFLINVCGDLSESVGVSLAGGALLPQLCPHLGSKSVSCSTQLVWKPSRQLALPGLLAVCRSPAQCSRFLRRKYKSMKWVKQFFLENIGIPFLQGVI